MHRRFLKQRDAFPKSADEYNQQVARFLGLRRADLDAAWGKLEKGWQDINERMVRFGLSPRTDDEDVVELNVGGLNVGVFWHLLAETEGFEGSVLFALLEGDWGVERIPRDADGRIVLDESPTCIKHIIAQTTLTANGRTRVVVAAGLPESTSYSVVATDEVPCLIYTAHVMGLSGYLPTHPKYVKMNGGSTILEPFEIAPLGATIREWVGGSTEELTLIYRATRDGFDTKSFKPECHEDITSHVISLIRVSCGKGSEDDDSVVGGYSVLPWGSVDSEQTITAETFLFMLKDGNAPRKNLGKPAKWKPYPKEVGLTCLLKKQFGACVGVNGLSTRPDSTTGGYTVKTRRDKFDIEEGSPFFALSGRDVVDVEVYRCSTPAPPTNTAPVITEPGGGALTDVEAHDIHYFGQLIASSLMEERVVLDRAVKEMKAAGARVSAAVGALETVYGPSVAAGEQDTVVELNVRGVRMTTLRSTLQACPCSALATMFNEDRWPATDKDNDNLGRRLIDCNPTCFSKILDVLRMRKRVSWSRGVEGVKQQEQEQEEEEEEEGSVGRLGAILIKEADVEMFSEAVNMYFPGCESFILDMVQSV